MPEHELVSVIIPTKNRRDLLAETLASVQAQTYPYWEALVCDDGSTDGTEEMVRAMAVQDPRIRWIPGDPRRPGAPARRNDGTRESRGLFAMFLDSDDLLDAECLAGRLAVMARYPSMAFIVCAGRLFRMRPGDGTTFWNEFNDSDDLERFMRGDAPWQTAGPLWRRDSLTAVGEWDERQPSWQDWEFHVRALACGIAYSKAARVDYSIRVHASDRVSTRDHTTERLDARIELVLEVYSRIAQTGRLREHHTRAAKGLLIRLFSKALVDQNMPVRRLCLLSWQLQSIGAFSTARSLLLALWVLLPGRRSDCALARLSRRAVIRLLPLPTDTASIKRNLATRPWQAGSVSLIDSPR